MKALIVDALKIIAPLSVALIVFAQALGISLSEVLRYFSGRNGLMLRSLAAALVAVPLAALVLILVLKPTPIVGFALAILVACPPAPLMISMAPQKGGASAAFMASLHLCLAMLAFVTVPAALYVLSIPLGFAADIDLAVMAWILARTILMPIALGLAVRAAFPAAADRFSPVIGKAGTIGLLLVVLFALAAFYPALLDMAPWSYLVIASVSITALAIGHWAGLSDPHERTTLAVECGVRHPVLALTIAGATFSPQQAQPVLVPCVITFIAIAIVYLTWRGKSLAKPA